MDLETLKTELRSAPSDVVDEVRVAALTEQERRDKLDQLPDQLEAMTRDAVAAGCDPDVLRARVDDALTPEQVAALEA